MLRDDPHSMGGHACASFMTLALSLAGWALFEAWTISIGATLFGHLLVAVPGLILAVFSLPRSSTGNLGPAGEKTGPLRGLRGMLVQLVFLFLVGALLGVLILAGVLVLLGLVVACLGFAPWSRLAFCRQHVVLCCASTLGGLACPIALAFRVVDPVFFLLAGWVFWLCACCALIVQAEKRRRVERKAKTGNNAVDAGAGPATIRT